MGGFNKMAAALLAMMAGLFAPAAAAQAPFDGLKVMFCGTSGPLVVKDRAKPCVAVQAGSSIYIVDIGPEATENLMLWRLPLANVKAVFITHLHSDHIGGLGELNMQSWVAGREAPLPVVGPDGVEALAAGFNQAYERDHAFRKAHHERGDVKMPTEAGLLAARTIVPAAGASATAPVTAQAWRDGDLSVTAIVVEHSPVSPAFAYRFDYKGRSVVISGDTAKWLPLAEASKGIDVMIHEAQSAEMTRTMVAGLKGMGQPRLASIMDDTLTYHATPVEAAEVAKAAGARSLVLYHLTQAGLPMFTPEAFTRGMDAVGGPPFKLASDGMTIELPAGSAEIKFGQF